MALLLSLSKRGKTIYRELRALGAKPGVARQVVLVANSRSWWRNSAMLLSSALTLAWFGRLSLPRSALSGHSPDFRVFAVQAVRFQAVRSA